MVKTLARSFIVKQKKLIEEEKTKILHQIEELKKNDPFADPDHASDNAAIDTDVREQVGHDTIEAQIKDLQRRLRDIDITMEKTAKGKYGYCEKCDMPIPLPRLELIPEARYCVECEKKLFS